MCFIMLAWIFFSTAPANANEGQLKNFWVFTSPATKDSLTMDEFQREGLSFERIVNYGKACLFKARPGIFLHSSFSGGL